jgi:hypothetical protein
MAWRGVAWHVAALHWQQLNSLWGRDGMHEAQKIGLVLGNLAPLTQSPCVPDACVPDACVPDACVPDACVPDACAHMM